MSEENEVDLEDQDSETTGQYVTFHIAEECFAFPMRAVLEIIRVQTTVGVPLTPRSLVGLTNLRGSVLPIVDMRRTLGLPEATYNDATRVVVVDIGKPVGLVVDRVARVLQVEASRVEAADSVQTTLNARLLTGVVKEPNGSLIQLLDVARILEGDFADIAHGQAGRAAATSSKTVQAAAQDEVEDDSSQLVSFLLEGQEYAFDIGEVKEIVRVPENISHVPCTDGHVLGVISLRNHLLPLVSIRRMFSMTEEKLADHNRILVVQSERGENVGIVVDRVREVLSVDRQHRDDVPGMLRSHSGRDQIESVCRLQDGKRLISILSAGALFSDPSVKSAVAEHQKEDVMTEGSDSVDTEESDDKETQLVVFQLAGQEYGVSIEFVQEIIRVPEQVSRVPLTPQFIDGMISLRGGVLPVIDMRVRFGQERMTRNDRQRILVFNLSGVRTGFVVDSVAEVLRLPLAVIEESPKLSPQQQRMVHRVANLKDSKRMIQVLAADHLLDKDQMQALSKAPPPMAA